MVIQRRSPRYAYLAKPLLGRDCFASSLQFVSPNVMYYLVWIGSVSGGFGYWRSEIFFVGGSLCNAVAFWNPEFSMNFPFFSLFFLKDSTLSSTVESNGVAQTLSEKKHVFFSVHALPITRTTAYQTVVYIRQKTKTYSNFNIHLLNIYTWLIVNSYFFIFHWFIFLLARTTKREDICQRFVSPLVTSKHR